MTTLGVAASMIQGARRGAQAARAQAAMRAGARATTRTGRSIATAFRRFVFTTGALGSFTLAAWTIDFRLGLLVAGICALLLEQLLSG